MKHSSSHEELKRGVLGALGPSAVLSAMTPGQKRRALLRAGDDFSTILHRFPDGWTINHHPEWGSIGREGRLLNNCWARGRDEVRAPAQYYDGVAAPYASLRDPDGYPHVAFYYNPSAPLGGEASGHGNAPIRDEYRDRLAAWWAAAHPEAPEAWQPDLRTPGFHPAPESS